MFLKRILATKRAEIDQLATQITLEDRKRARALPPCSSLQGAIQGMKDYPALIAEVKPASPSKGRIQAQVNPVETALDYERGGACAISVLTDQEFFGGSLESLRQVKEAVAVPLLRKDFILDPLQIIESRLSGADAILLIAALHSAEKLEELTTFAHELGLEVLIEVHREEEIAAALQARPDVIGINNRDLHTFVTDLEVTRRLLPHFPADTLVIGESGVQSADDLSKIISAGAAGALVGEYLMRQPSAERAVEQLLEGAKRCLLSK